MSSYRVDWECCGDATITECWEPTRCPFCELEEAEVLIENIVKTLEEVRDYDRNNAGEELGAHKSVLEALKDYKIFKERTK